MKCPECGGEQKIIHWTSGQPRYLTCERCGGTGEVDSMTNMEWIQSMSEKELAEHLWRSKNSYWGDCIDDLDRLEIMQMQEWLKEQRK